MLTCTNCHTEKPVTDFHRNSTTPRGYQVHCKVCLKAKYEASRERRGINARRFVEAQAEQKHTWGKDIFIKRPKSKRCSKCQMVKPLSKFYANSHASDGLRTNCKGCANKQVKQGRISLDLFFKEKELAEQDFKDLLSRIPRDLANRCHLQLYNLAHYFDPALAEFLLDQQKEKC